MVRILPAALILLFAAPLHAAPVKIKWLLGHPNLDYFEEAAAKFKATVESESRGEISVEIVTAEREALGDVSQAKADPEIAGLVARGEAQMGHSFANVLAGVEPKMQVFEAPYLFRGYRHLEGVFEGPVGREMLEGLGEKGLVGLSFTYSGGASGVATTGRELRSPEDLKGLKVGVFGDAVDSAWLKSLGATPVPIKHRRDLIHSLSSTGELDAAIVTWRNFERAALNPRFSRFNLQGSSYLVSVTYANKKFLEALPAKHRDLIARASRECGRIERAQTIELNETSKREMQAKGVRPVYLSERALERFERALKPAYAGDVRAAIGDELLEKIRRTPDAPVHPLIPRDELAGR
jgi:TRAP-type C4-dicarboxylate transport system substrate-binding protein